jgi:CHAT domain-containing protein
VLRSDRFHIAESLWILLLIGGIQYPVARAAVDPNISCESPLLGQAPLFTTTVELQGGARVTRELSVPPRTQLLVIATETGLDATLEATRAGQVIGRTASPVYRTGIERLAFQTERGGSVSLSVEGKGDTGSHGHVAIRVFTVGASPGSDGCVQVQLMLAAADSHYAAAQSLTATAGNDAPGDAPSDAPSDAPKTSDAPREYKAAADQYLAVVRRLESQEPSRLLAYTQHALAATLYDWVRDWTGARSWAQAAAGTYRLVNDSYGEARAQAIEAAAFMETALAFRSPASGREGVRRTAAGLREARQQLISVAAFHSRRGETFEQALALNNIGLAYYYEGRSDDAIRSYRSAETAFGKIGEERWKASAQQNSALADYELGRVYDAIAQYTRLLQSSEANEDPLVLATILNNSALANWAAGNMDVALRQYARALELERKLQNAREQARSLLGIGSVYETLGDSDLALDFFRQSLSLRGADLDVRGRAASLRSTANVLRLQGSAREALVMDDEALSLASTSARRGPIQIQRARDLDALGRHDEALKVLDSVIDEQTSGREVVRAQALLERARSRASKGEQVAQADLRSAISTFEAQESPVDEFSAWVALAELQHRHAAVDKALDSLAHAMRLAEEVRLQSASPELRASLLQPLRPAFDLRISLLAERYFGEGRSGGGGQRGRSAVKALSAPEARSAMEALSTAEQARARAFADFESLDVGMSADTAHLLEQRRAIYRELAARHFQLESRRDRAGEDDSRVREIRADIAALRVRLDEADAQISARGTSERVRSTGERWTPDLRRIPPDTAVIEYWLGADNAVAWVLTHDRLEMVDLGVSAKVTEAARAFHTSLRGFGSIATSVRLLEGSRLYGLVIRPLERYVKDKHRLIFAPDGALHYVPFAALQAGEGDQQGFLVESHDIAVTPSVRMLLDRHARANDATARPAGLLLVSDPVYSADDERLRATAPTRTAHATAELDVRSTVFRGAYAGVSFPRLAATAQESAAIASLFTQAQVERLEGFEATKDRFLGAHLERYRFIHVASHAITDAQVPGLSALALSAFDSTGRTIDNLVFAADFTTLRLNADLLVLSACDTALGKNVAGEGLVGLRYITLARGARAVVASLWEVPDQATSELMMGFYQSFLAGHTPVESALSEAMRSMLRGPRSDPAEWGAFTATLSGLDSLR